MQTPSSAYPRTVEFLSREDEANLLTRWIEKGDQRARDKVIVTFIPLARKEAKRYVKFGLDIEDLTQEGTQGLILATDRFDVSKGFRFSTYATYWIRHYLHSFAEKNAFPFKVNATQGGKRFLFSLLPEIEQIKAAAPGTTTDAAIALVAQRTGASVARLNTIYRLMCGGAFSLDRTVGEDSTAGNFMADSAAGPEAIVEESSRLDHIMSVISDAMSELNDREREIVSRRHLAEEGEKQTLDQLAEHFGVSRERIRQIEGKALAKVGRAVKRSVR